MKKTLSIVLCIIMASSITACGKKVCSIEGCGQEAIEDASYEELYCTSHLKNKKAFDASKEAYGNVNKGYEIAENMGSDIYEAWRCAIYDHKDIEKEGLTFLCKKMELTEDELAAGLASLFSDDFSTLSDSDKKSAIKDAKDTFTYLFKKTDSQFSLAVNVTTAAYKVKGDVDTATELFSTAKSQMKDLSDKYSDYEHYPALKGYYTTASSFFDFCQNPTGSFEQLKSTIEDYRNQARDYKSDLDYIFED